MYELLSNSGGLRKKILHAVAVLPLVTVVGTFSVVAADRLPTYEDPASFSDAATQLKFSSPLEAYRQGKAAYDEGWYGLALPALRFAAKRGVFGARLKLAKMCELGLGMPIDEPAAFDLYKKISDKHWNIPSYHPAARYIGETLAALGLYYLNGIDEMGLKPDIRRAATYFTHAAQYFGNPRAQYQLAKLYLAGHGVKKNVRRAVLWLKNATKKKHAPSQALLGQLFWEGELVPKRQITALALLTMAQENAGPQDSEWINELHQTIVAASDLKTKQGAKTAVARWVKIYRPRVTKRIIIRKQVRVGIAEDGRRFVQRKQTIKRQTMPDGSYSLRGPVIGRKRSVDRLSSEDRRWIGLGRFRELDVE